MSCDHAQPSPMPRSLIEQAVLRGRGIREKPSGVDISDLEETNCAMRRHAVLMLVLPISMAAEAPEMAAEMTCGDVKAFYKEHACCGHPDTDR